MVGIGYAETRFTRYLLDTNALRALVEQNPVAMQYYSRIFPDLVKIPIVTYAEEVKGWVNPPSNDERRADLNYRMLGRYLAVMGKHEIVPYSLDAMREFDKLPPNIGVKDKRIAACAIAYGFTVVTSNAKDFARLLPRDQFVDWTVEAAFLEA